MFFITRLIDGNLLFFALIFLGLIRTWQSSSLFLEASLVSAFFTSRHNGDRENCFLKHTLPFPFIVFNKASLLIQREERGESGNGMNRKGKSKQFWVSSHFFSLRAGKKKKSIMEHTWILFRAHSHPLSARPLENQITQQTYRWL